MDEDYGEIALRKINNLTKNITNYIEEYSISDELDFILSGSYITESELSEIISGDYTTEEDSE